MIFRSVIDLKNFEEIDSIADYAKGINIDWIIIAGGDGTIRGTIAALEKRNIMPYISVFPAGTVNLVAKELQQVLEPQKWIKRVKKGIVTPVYLGKANNEIFLTVAGVGFDSLVVDNVSETQKKLLSKFAYLWHGSELIRKEMLFSNWRYKFKIRLDDDTEWHEATSVIVGKSRYYAGRYSIFADAALGSPFLNIAMFKGHKSADFFRYATLIAMEALTLDKEITIKKAKKIEIICENDDFVVELDGDAVTNTPLKLEIKEIPIKFLA